MAIVISDVNALRDFLNSEVLPAYKDCENLTALIKEASLASHWFPLVLIGKGSTAWVFQTPKGTALRLAAITGLDLFASYVDSNNVADLTAYFYQQCAAQNNKVELFPQIYYVALPNKQTSVVEMEKLEPMHHSPLFRKYNFMKKWENAHLDGMPLESILFQGWLKHRTELERLPPENMLSLVFSALYNLRSLTEYQDSHFINAIRDKYPQYLNIVREMLEKCTSSLNIPDALDEITLDVHTDNIMYRPGKNQLVLIDPISY